MHTGVGKLRGKTASYKRYSVYNIIFANSKVKLTINS